MSKIQPVIMCGGSGTRVWPESRESLPKQFIPLIGDRSTFQSVVSLVGDRSIFEPPAVITNFDYRFRVAEQLKEIGAEATILLEPERRDSAAAVGAAAAWAAGRDPSTVVAVLAADHVFKDGAKFAGLCAQAGAAAEAGEIVTFGVTPDHPATGYGYIHPGEALAVDPQVRRVERFVEKPDEERAKGFIAEGYLWNSGNFVFRADVMLEELERFEPGIAAASREGVARAKTDLGFVVLDRESFIKAPKMSIAFAVMERTHRAAVLAADVGWSDVGQWSTVWRLSPQDERGGRAADAAVLAGDQPRSDNVRELVERLKAERRLEAIQGQRMYRPWGYFETVLQGDGYQVKHLVLRAGGRQSLQKHYHRTEHLIVLHGTAEVTVNGAVRLVRENESVDLPIASDHRLANPGKINVELIEVQTGSYLGEDDIVRIEDAYNRP